MDEFTLIKNYFQKNAISRAEVKFGIGDDCACIKAPPDKDLLISIDTLVRGVHFLPTIDPYAIAYKAVMVNISDCVAMAAEPFAVLLALTIEEVNENWLERFSRGLKDALAKYNIALIGGDLTRGPLSITITIQALAPSGKAVYRHGARAGDIIYVSGYLGLAAYAVKNRALNELDKFTQALHYPTPRVDLIAILRAYATSAIDISDGLLADLNHICTASKLGASIDLAAIPREKLNEDMLDFALNGGDDYEICFTIPKASQKSFLAMLAKAKLKCYAIGVMQQELGIFTKEAVKLLPQGYMHFKDLHDE
ncbi:MAG: thiamine-phosphate kinase [Legionellales bacterium RIFCSPHIGHO2_12_FULL_37_14]|nr:MAG: thiamine-phosphate kinase [Legionellales bacterium RIFCSPHIGHO2_12_FULL_37_14]